VAVDPSGNTYVTDAGNHTIRKITAAGVVTTIAGLAGTSGSADGTGAAARFFLPRGIATDSAGTLYVTDSYNRTIRKVTPAGVVTTLAGLAGNPGVSDGAGPLARFSSPSGIAVDTAGNLYVADGATIRGGGGVGRGEQRAGDAHSVRDPDARCRPESQYSDRVTTLDAVLERIVAVAQPDRVILFGSAARGTADPHSDLDLLVIKRGVVSRRRLARTIYRALVGIRASVDVLVMTPEDVESLKDGVGTIVGPAIREGLEVYAA
jgi:predicted nucleotidyltransferase